MLQEVKRHLKGAAQQEQQLQEKCSQLESQVRRLFTSHGKSEVIEPRSLSRPPYIMQKCTLPTFGMASHDCLHAAFPPTYPFKFACFAVFCIFFPIVGR